MRILVQMTRATELMENPRATAARIRADMNRRNLLIARQRKATRRTQSAQAIPQIEDALRNRDVRALNRINQRINIASQR